MKVRKKKKKTMQKKKAFLVIDIPNLSLANFSSLSIGYNIVEAAIE